MARAPRHYGPWEQFVSLLTEGLVARGVDVTLFATGDSETSANLSSVMPEGYAETGDVDVKVWESLHISEVFERAAEFDLIHNSFDFLPLTYSSLVATPMVTTIHGFSSERILPVYQKYNGRTHYVAISDADRHPTLDYLATIHHGIDTDALRLASRPGRVPAVLRTDPPRQGDGRGHRRWPAGPVCRWSSPASSATSAYFDREVARHLDGTDVRYLGPVGPGERKEILGGAHALLHLINFDEPFGFSVVEALASGTPVIAIKRGSMPELVNHGRTGFLVHDNDEATDAVALAGGLDRAAIRAEAIRRFGRERMVDRYLDAYRRILNGSPRGDD